MAVGIEITENALVELEARLLNTSGQVPLHDRFRALFTLKAIGGQRAVNIIGKGFVDPSALLKHELAYVLGQINDPSGIPILSATLADKKEDPMVRHEAAEALGAISDYDSLPLLRRYLEDPERVVRETCDIAIAKIQWDQSPEGCAERARQEEEKREAERNGTLRQFTSIDPAPPSLSSDPSSGHSGLLRGSKSASDVPHLRDRLLDTTLPLFERYRAMFALRNIGSPAAIDALADGFGDDSALFKHEIAFVFGQLADPHAIPSLLKVLRTSAESDMVRHEAAEALGGIAEVDQDKPIVVDGERVDVQKVLKEWMLKPDAPEVVKQSCQVAVDMWEVRLNCDSGISRIALTG
ncbi:deoxyhypusine hydroxylase [Tulasnella sp. JGI-2019a]|nr:deoxyhypusine hydroxylase [Tulasnella sp. JGI-2019a]